MPAFDRERLKTIEAAAFLLAAAAEVILRKVGGIAGRPFAAWFFGAANGSVWEQMKVLFFSFIGVSLPEYFVAHAGFMRFFTAKAAAAAVLVLSYAALWYTLTGIAGRGLTAADTAIAQAAGAALLTALAFLLSFRLIVRGGGHAVAFVSAVAALAAMTAMFCCFTLLPPEVDLFRDPLSGRYGLDSGPINEIAGALFAGPAAPQTCINAKRV